MHMADGLVAPAVAGVMYVCSIAVAGYSVKKVRIENDEKKIPLMGIMGAFVFAAQMINFTIPGTGSSGHICGGVLLSAMLGPYAGFLTMIAILLVQCLLFADGGLLALGCNIWNMAFYGCFIGSFIIWHITMRSGVSKKKIIIASVLGSIITLQLGSFSVTLQTLASGITELPFTAFVATMQPIHLAIGLVEGVITAAVLSFIYEARPTLLWTTGKLAAIPNKKQARLCFSSVIMILTVAALIIGGGLSYFASSNPDGLEWSINTVAGASDIERSGMLFLIAEKIQNVTALFPGYSFKKTDSFLATSVSGIMGSLFVVGLCALFCLLFRFFRNKVKHE